MRFYEIWVAANQTFPGTKLPPKTDLFLSELSEMVWEGISSTIASLCGMQQLQSEPERGGYLSRGGDNPIRGRGCFPAEPEDVWVQSSFGAIYHRERPLFTCPFSRSPPKLLLFPACALYA